MKVSDYVVDVLINNGVTDVFGIPGGVVLDLLDSMGKRSGEISARLNSNEQASAFAASGYAQASGKLAAAYATRGPGITNMVTGIADAYCESLPVLFITAHSHTYQPTGTRVAGAASCRPQTQEFDTVGMMSPITKYAVSIDNADDVRYELEKACCLAVCGRPGPVFVDFKTSVLRADADVDLLRGFVPKRSAANIGTDINTIINTIKSELQKSKRPVLLIGDGVKQSKTRGYAETLVDKMMIPVLSSRSAQDVVPASPNYYGYIGSHGLRYANFILSKCDLIISLGNRLAFDPKSKSFGVITERAKIIRIDIDENEFNRAMPNTENFIADLRDLMPSLINSVIEWRDDSGWVDTCVSIKNHLCNHDTDHPVGAISALIKSADPNAVLVGDVGNNEFLLSRAYARSGALNRVLYSKSFSPLGNSLSKSIGAYYSTGKRIICLIGDQGLQMNIGELQFVAKNNLPITIVILNNFSSGMIRDQQERKFNSRFLCTTPDDGYGVPDFEKVANAFGIKYFLYDGKGGGNALASINHGGPVCVEIRYGVCEGIIPYLPVGNLMYDLAPDIDGSPYI